MCVCVYVHICTYILGNMSTALDILGWVCQIVMISAPSPSHFIPFEILFGNVAMRNPPCTDDVPVESFIRSRFPIAIGRNGQILRPCWSLAWCSRCEKNVVVWDEGAQ